MIANIIALLFASGEAMSKKELATLCSVQVEEIESALTQVREALQAIGLTIVESGAEVQLVTKEEQSPLVHAMLKKDLEGELTPATLQVLTIIAYLGPVSRSDISFIRGVQSSQSIRTLTARGLIVRSGEQCELTIDALRFLGVETVSQLPDYEGIHSELKTKLQESRQEM